MRVCVVTGHLNPDLNAPWDGPAVAAAEAMRNHPVRLVFALFAAVAVMAASACGNSPTAPSAAAGSGAAGTLNLRITDSPYSDAKSLLVTFSEVTAHRSGVGGSNPLPFDGGATSRTCDLKKLEGAQDVLGVGALPAGHYTQLRLVVSSATLYFDKAATGPACAPTVTTPAGRSAALEIASGEVKLNRQFEVSSTAATTIVVDFDGDKSVHQMGNGRYRMTPVISVVSVQ
jgi:hypothetical protein